MFNRIKKWVPKGLLWRLTSLNMMVIALSIILIGWAVYETACMLTAGMGGFGEQRQQQFNATLLQYVLLFSMIGIVVGAVLHLHITKRIIRPINELIESTKQMKMGRYPDQIQVQSEGELADLAEQFNDMVEMIKQNEYERKKLVTDLSHEIRTPLSNLSGYLQALQSGVIEGDQKLYLSLYKEAGRLHDMVNQLDQLKEWDHIMSEQIETYQTVDITDHIKQSVAMFRWMLDDRGIDVHLEVEPQMVKIKPSGIEQVLNNILQNAIQYYDGEDDIIVKGKQERDIYTVSVTGPSRPIAKNEQSQIFDRFYRVDSSRSRETGGSGLGLAIAKEIIDHHQGKIGIRSNGQLNTIWFSIPLG